MSHFQRLFTNVIILEQRVVFSVEVKLNAIFVSSNVFFSDDFNLKFTPSIKCLLRSLNERNRDEMKKVTKRFRVCRSVEIIKVRIYINDFTSNKI